MIAPWPPLNAVGIRRPVRLAGRLEEYGWRPVVMTPSPTDRANYPSAPIAADLYEPDVEVHRVPGAFPLVQIRRAIGALGKRVPLGRIERALQRAIAGTLAPDHLTEWLPAAVRAARKLARETTFDAVWATAPPFGGALVGAAVARAIDAPYVADFRDPWTQAPAAALRNRRRVRAMEEIEALVLRSAAGVSYVCQAQYDWNTARFGRPAKTPWVVIPNGFDPRDFPTDAPHHFARPTIIYAGGLYGSRTMVPIFRALLRLLDANRPTPDLVIHAQLQPAAADLLARSAQLRGVVHVHGYVPFTELAPKLLGVAANLVLTAPEHVHAVGVKTIDSFITRRPILEYGPAGNLAALTIAATGTGRSVSFAEGEEVLADALEEVATGELRFEPNEDAIAEWTAERTLERTAALLDEVSR